MDAMAQQFNIVNKKPEKIEAAAIKTPTEADFICGICGGSHENHMCSLIKEDAPVEQANYMGNQNPRNTNFQNHPLFPPQQRPPYQQPLPSPQQNNLLPPPKPQPTSFEAALEKLTLTTTTFVQTTNNFMEETRANFRNQEAAIRNLETQVDQIAKQLATTLPNAFPSDT
ncbi:hypothetical protein PIB30_107064 [Stylosanthes scabra]|uniref:Uncharacterized protein n=1 Tax=Stylosanthes scabra TaxID=79078 RepID=A0ABU6XWH1_9FABA|nr:hypothetical protein [Stylosanthes scabra]